MSFIKIKRAVIDHGMLLTNTLYDYWMFLKHYTRDGSLNNNSSKCKYESWILQDKHRIEKAFSLPEPRFGFGKSVMKRLSNNLTEYSFKFGKDSVYYIGVGAIKSYKKFHDNNNQDLPSFFKSINEFFSIDFHSEICNSVGFTKEIKVSDSAKNGFNELARSRKSCRNFSQKEISESILKNVMELSITAPSVCNRQHWKVRFFKGDKKKEVLSFQNGNSGFTNNIPMVAVITSDVNAFYNVHERNQPYTDSGMFAMNFLYSLQVYGLSSCPLNWCNSAIKDVKFRKSGLIPSNEVISMVIAIGYSEDCAQFAKSPRLNVDGFYTIK